MKKARFLESTRLAESPASLLVVRDFLREAAEERPDHLFIEAPRSSVTFARADERVSTMAGGLKDLGIRRYDRVAVWASNQIDSALAIFAIWRVGGICELVNTRLTEGEVHRQLQRANSQQIVGVNPPKLGFKTVDPGSLSGDPIEGSKIDPADTALIIHTSGPAGGPKGVRLTFANLDSAAASCSAQIHQTPEDRWLTLLPLSQIGGASIIIRCVRRGNAAVLEPGFRAERVVEILSSGSVTLASMVPPMLRRVLEVSEGPFHGLRALLLSGASVSDELCARAAVAGIPVIPTYGMTETASHVATARLSDAFGPRWRLVAVPGAQVRSVDGILQARGPMVSPGYVGELDRSPSDWFVTGDLGEVDDQGVISVFGRADEVIVTGGDAVFPAEVEHVLESHPEVREAIVVGIPNEVFGSQVVAVFSGDALIAELERFARAHLAGFKVPKRWVRLERIPKTGLDKPDRQMLIEMLSRI